jgi:hypothetical protein
MALAGHIDDFPLAELLFYLSSKQRSGRLVLKQSGVTITFALRRGRLIGAQMTPGDQRLGDRLVADSRLSPDQLEQALIVQRLDPARPALGALLVELDYVGHDTVEQALRQQIADCLFQILIAPGGAFAFREQDADLKGIEIDVVIEREVLDAIRRADEWAASQIDHSPIRLNEQITSDALESIILDSWDVVDAMLEGAETVDEIIAVTNWERDRVIGLLLQLQACGAVQFDVATERLRNQIAA